MIEIQRVTSFNEGQKRRYYEAVEKWKQAPQTEPHPFLGHYLFLLPNGEERKRGWVASNGKRHHFSLNKWNVVEGLTR